MMEAATEIFFEKIVLWQDFTQPNGYRDTLKMVRLPHGKWAYEFNVGGTVQVIPYKKFWEILE